MSAANILINQNLVTGQRLFLLKEHFLARIYMNSSGLGRATLAFSKKLGLEFREFIEL